MLKYVHIIAAADWQFLISFFFLLLKQKSFAGESPLFYALHLKKSRPSETFQTALIF